MKNIPSKCAEKITITLTEAVEASGGYSMSEADLKKLKGVHPLYKACYEVLGKRLGVPILIGNVISMEVLPDTQAVPYPLKDLLGDMVVTGDELRRNASLPVPLAHKAAIRRPQLIGMLKAVAAADANHRLSVTFHTADGPTEVPVLEAADFTEPVADDTLAMLGTFLVVGIRRDDARGHRLILTDNDLFVSLPRNDPRWTWEAIHHLVDSTNYLEGKLVRKSKSDPWTVETGAKFVKEAEFDAVGA